jgi:hypothetical protein
MKLLNRSLAFLLVLAVGGASAQTLVQPQFEPDGWNTETRQNSNGSFTTKNHTQWVNFLNAQKDWRKIDTRVDSTLDGYEVTDAPFVFKAPQLADGDAYFESNNRWDVLAKREITAAPIGVWLRSLDAAPVLGVPYDMGDGYENAVLYANAFPQWNADLIYYVRPGAAPTLQKLVRFNSSPVKVDARFSLRFTEEPDILLPNKAKWNKAKLKAKSFAFKKKNTEERRGIGMKPYKIWDSNAVEQKSQAIDSSLEVAGADYILTKHIPSSFFTGAVFPVFTDATLSVSPDANPESLTMDADIAAGAFADWAGAYSDTDGVPTSDISDSAITLRPATQCDAGPNYYIRRAFLLFDTSSLGATATISSAIFTAYNIAAQRVNGDNDGVDYISLVGNSNPASNTSIAATDYDQTGATEMSDTHIDITNLGSDGTQTWTVNATGLTNISKTGITKWAMREGHDQTNDAIACNQTNQAGFRSADDTNGTDPTLEVTYTLPAASNDVIQIIISFLFPPAFAR